MKIDDYVLIHKVFSKISSPNVIIKVIADGGFDDFISKVPPSCKDNVLEVANKVFEYKRKVSLDIMDKYLDIMSNMNITSKKDFMIYVDKNVNNTLKSFVRCEYLNQQYNVLKSISGKYKTMKEIEEYINEK